MNQHFTHLHLHTEYSLLDGAIKITDLVDFAKKQGWKALGISDHGNIFGAVKFFQECKKANIKPILGCEMYLTSDIKIKDVKDKYYHLLVIAQNQVGYKNLCKLIAFSYKEGFYFKPRIDYERLKQFSEGLIITTACIGGHIPSLLAEGKEDEAKDRAEWFLEVFGRDKFFIEIQPGEYEKQIATNELLINFAKKMDLQLVATSDSHYLHKDDHEAHEILLSIGTRSLMSDSDRYSFGDCRAYLKTTPEMLNFFPEYEEAVWNSGKIADMCDFNFEFGKLFFPAYEVPKEHTQDSFFREWCKKGLEKLYENGLVPKEEYQNYQDRLSLEIDLIIKMGFVGYFLVVGDFIGWAKMQKIAVGPGRGSAAGSLVAWALGITNVDPIKYNLLFERFLNPERVSMPDIDIDFCIQRREEVINYVKDKYGHDCVCQIITFGTMMAKAVIKDVARALGFPFSDANAISDLIPDQLKITLKEAIEQEPKIQELINTNPGVKKLFDVGLRLEGITRHASKHAAGVVISPKPLDEMLPLYIPAKTNDLVAQYAMSELEAVGFLKMDFLGLKNLTLIEQTLISIKRNHGVDIDLDKLSFDDPKAFQLLCKGNTDGVFQFESDGIKDVLRKLQPDKFEDLIAVNALYRPGPLGSGMVDDFIERRHGRKKTTYMFDELEPILSETYGVIVYQEQVMKIASSIAGYTLGGADILRRAMGKKKAEEMAKQKSLFVDGATTRGFDKKKSEELFDLMAYFAGYGFNKSHSTAYALIAYHTAYLKANFPKEFMAALVSFETDNPDKLTQYLQEISDMGIVTIPPNINSSEIEFAVVDDKILFGLKGIKNVGLAALENIFLERKKGPFKDLLDFCIRVDLRVVNKRVIENLICTGAMDCFGGNRAQKFNELEKIISIATEKKEAAKTGQMSLFGLVSEDKSKSETEAYTFAPCQDWSDQEKLEKEKELAGFYLSSHPLKMYQHLYKWLNCPTFLESLKKLESANLSKEPTIIGIGLMQSHKVINTKKGDKMAFAQLDDFSGSAEIILFPKTFKECENYLSSNKVFFVKGTLDASSLSKCKIKANLFFPIDLIFQKADLISEFEIGSNEKIEEETCKKIKEILQAGSSSLKIRFIENEKNLQLIARGKFFIKQESLKELEGLKLKVNFSI